MTVKYSAKAERTLRHMRRSDPNAYAIYEKLLPRVERGEGKVLSGWSDLGKCRSLRSGKFRLVYAPGSPPEILLAGYRKDVYQSDCDN
jgi:hypothetical protein